MEFSIAMLRNWLNNPANWRASPYLPGSGWHGQLFPLDVKDPVVQGAMSALGETIDQVEKALSAGLVDRAAAWHARVDDQFDALRTWVSEHPPKGRPKGSKKPQQQKRSQDQEQLEKLERLPPRPISRAINQLIRNRRDRTFIGIADNSTEQVLVSLDYQDLQQQKRVTIRHDLGIHR
jgi:hypothetical protein